MPRNAPTALVLIATLAFTAWAADLSADLLAAASKGDADAVKALLDRGADVNARNSYGATALTYAADKGHVAVVKLLLKNKADLNVKDTFYKAAPLTWAVQRNHVEIVKALVEAGAAGADDALQGAAAQGRVEIVRAILDTGKLPEAALTRVLAATPARHTMVVKLLKKAGAKPSPKAEGTVAADLLKAYAGLYRSDNGGELTIGVEEGRLTAGFGTSSAIPLNALDKTSFKLTGSAQTIAFQREGNKANALTLKNDKTETAFRRVETATEPGPKTATVEDRGGVVKAPRSWPSFRGPNASGAADGQLPPITWDVDKNRNIRWKTPIPGLGHSCPIVWEDRVYLTTAVSRDGKSELRPGLYGDVDSVDEATEHTWRVICLDKHSGKVLWDEIACKGVPKVKRHPKATHANPTPATDGTHIIASFGSEGLYCYDPRGKLLWKKSLGVLSSGWFYDADYQWGFGSSPILYKDLVIVQCDVGKGSFLAAFQVADGQEVWRKSRDEISSWGTPTIVAGPERVELVTNATKFARGYDPLTGAELWRLARHSEITVPTPIFGAGLIFVASGYRPVQPIYAIRPGAAGDISLGDDKTTSDAIAWSTTRGGPYMPTPLVYGDYLYVCSNAGMMTCYEAKTGRQVYRERLGGNGGYTASPVAADGTIYFTSEQDGIRVVQAGPKFALVAINLLGDPCMATPAISDGMLFVRTQHYLFGIGRTDPR